MRNDSARRHRDTERFASDSLRQNHRPGGWSSFQMLSRVLAIASSSVTLCLRGEI